MKIVAYILLGGQTIVDLQNSVNKSIEKGFVPIGGVCFSDVTKINQYIQAMVMYGSYD